MLRTLAQRLGPVPSLPGCSAALGAAWPSSNSSGLLPWLRPAAAAGQMAWYSTEQFKKHVRNAHPASLEFQRQPAEELQQDAQRGFTVRALLTLGGYYSKESRLMRAAQRLYTAVTEQAVCPPFLSAMGMPPGFQQVHSSLCLHIWLLLVRLRAEGKDGKQLAQMLYDDFQTDVEDRVRQAGVRVRLSKQLTELEKQFYGSSMAYDKAMQQNSEPLEKALHRNVYMLAPGAEADATLLARYVRRELACLSMTPSAAVMSGNLKFTSLGLESEAGSTLAAAEVAPDAAPAAGTTA